jgi:hypothetical protein
MADNHGIAIDYWLDLYGSYFCAACLEIARLCLLKRSPASATRRIYNTPERQL